MQPDGGARTAKSKLLECFSRHHLNGARAYLVDPDEGSLHEILGKDANGGLITRSAADRAKGGDR
jgi:hypothetical protein